jgi:hypothetical protein
MYVRCYFVKVQTAERQNVDNQIVGMKMYVEWFINVPYQILPNLTYPNLRGVPTPTRDCQDIVCT